MAKKRPLQAKIARAAGIYRAKLSAVLNEFEINRVPIIAGTRQSGSPSPETRTIGVLLPIHKPVFYWRILSGILAEAKFAGYSVIHRRLTPAQETEDVWELNGSRVDAMILLVGFRHLSMQVTNQICRSDRPIVEICAAPSEFDLVSQSFGTGTHTIMKHLMLLGHRRIGFLYGVSTDVQGFDRLDEYRQVLEETGLSYEESLVRECGETMQDGYEAAGDLLRRPDRPTALIATNNLMGIAALRAARDLKLLVPKEVSIAIFDDVSFGSHRIRRLTSVTSRPEQNGREAVRLLLKRLAHPDPSCETITSGWQLNIGESTGPAPLL